MTEEHVDVSVVDVAKGLCSKKLETLRLIETRISDGLVDETILDSLEAVEKLDTALGNASSESIGSAYCAAALECTVALLVGSGGEPGVKYSNAFDRIWRRRIQRLEDRGGECGIVSGELSKCRDKLESSFRDGAVRAELCGSNTRNEALRLVRAYLEEEELRYRTWVKELPDPVDNCVNEGEPEVSCLDLKPAVPVKIVMNAQQTVDKLAGIGKPVHRDQIQADILPQPGLIEPKTSTKPIYKLDNQVDGSPEAATPTTTIPRRRRVCTPRPKRKAKDEPQPLSTRRKARRWSLLEEDVLRNAVRRFGYAWKLILTTHCDEFEERTEVDLKDKWRNMTKYSQPHP